VAFRSQLPVLLTRGARVPAETLTALEDLGIEQVVITGGTAVVTDEVERAPEQQVGNPAIRLGGVNRAETSTLVADFATRFGDFSVSDVFVAAGATFPDAIAAGPIAGQLGAPILLVEPGTVPDAVTGFLLLNDAVIERITAVGGTRVLPGSVLVQAGQGGVAGYVREDAFTDTAVSVADMIADPGAFYVNVHSAAYPAGAVRGQLPDGGQAAVADAVSPLTLTLDAEHVLTVDGTDVSYGASTETGTAEVALTFDLPAGTIGYRLDVSGLRGDLAGGDGAHIHEGLVDRNGGIVATLATGDELASAPEGVVTGTLTADDFRERFDLLTVGGLFVASSDFYVNVSTAENPTGAVRGQLPDGGRLPSP
jgi:hypothetical protein